MSAVFALNLPIVPEDKVEKFIGFFLGLIQKYDSSIKKADIVLPVKDKMSLGYAIIKTSGFSVDNKLAASCDHMAIDKTTRARVITVEQLKGYIQQGVLEPPVKLDIPQENDAFSWFHLDEEFREQILFRTGPLPNVAWFNHNKATIDKIDLPPSLSNYNEVQYSNDGIYLVGKNDNNLDFFVGKRWIHFTRFTLNGLKSYSFSPCNKFVMLKAELEADNQLIPNGAIIHNIANGNRVARICVTKDCVSKLKFGFDSNVFLSNERHLKVSRAPEFKEFVEICPDSDAYSASLVSPHVISYRVGNEAVPPRYNFYNVETLKSVHTHVSFNVIDSESYWHPKLNLCAVIQTRKHKGKNLSSLVVFDLSDEAHVSTLQHDTKGIISLCSWDPTKKQIAIVLSTESGKHIETYNIDSTINLVNSFPTPNITNLQHSPYGRFMIADSINDSTSVQFWDSQYGLIKTVEIPGVKSLSWDSSGAYILAFQTNAFSIWLFDGQQVLKNKANDLKQVLWRPISSRLIVTEEERNSIQDQLEEVLKRMGRFGVIDQSAIEEDKIEKRKAQFNNWFSEGKENKNHIPQQNVSSGFSIRELDISNRFPQSE